MIEIITIINIIIIIIIIITIITIIIITTVINRSVTQHKHICKTIINSEIE